MYGEINGNFKEYCMHMCMNELSGYGQDIDQL